MNKSQLKQFEMIKAYATAGNNDAVARGLSAMYRCAMTNKSKTAILNAANELQITHNPDFII